MAAVCTAVRKIRIIFVVRFHLPAALVEWYIGTAEIGSTDIMIKNCIKTIFCSYINPLLLSGFLNKTNYQNPVSISHLKI